MTYWLLGWRRVTTRRVPGAAVLRAVLHGVDRAAVLSTLLRAIRRRTDPTVVPPPAPTAAGGRDPGHFESFGEGELAVFVRADEDGFDDFEAPLEAMPGGVAGLREQAYHDGVGQWVIGR